MLSPILCPRGPQGKETFPAHAAVEGGWPCEDPGWGHSGAARAGVWGLLLPWGPREWPGWRQTAHWPGSPSKVTRGHHHSGLAREPLEGGTGAPSPTDLGPDSGQKGTAQGAQVGPWVTWVGPWSLEAKSRAEAPCPPRPWESPGAGLRGPRRCARLQGLWTGLG